MFSTQPVGVDVALIIIVPLSDGIRVGFVAAALVLTTENAEVLEGVPVNTGVVWIGRLGVTIGTDVLKYLVLDPIVGTVINGVLLGTTFGILVGADVGVVSTLNADTVVGAKVPGLLC